MIILDIYQKQKFINQFWIKKLKLILIWNYCDEKLAFYEIDKSEKQIIIKNEETHILEVSCTKNVPIYIYIFTMKKRL